MSPKRLNHDKSYSNISYLSKTQLENSKRNIGVLWKLKVYEAKFVWERIMDEQSKVENIVSEGRFLLWESKNMSSSKLLKYLAQTKWNNDEN